MNDNSKNEKMDQAAGTRIKNNLHPLVRAIDYAFLMRRVYSNISMHWPEIKRFIFQSLQEYPCNITHEIYFLIYHGYF